MNDYTQHRIDLFDKLKAEYDAVERVKQDIAVTLPDGTTRTATSYESSPIMIAKGIAKSLADKTIIAKVDGVLWDLLRPLEHDCSLEFLSWDDDEAKMVFWHSSAHILGEACEMHYGCHLCIGPPIHDGYYYEMGGMDKPVAPADFPALETLSKKIVGEKQRFERLVVSKENLLEMFKHNKFKVHIITDKIPDGTSTTVYRCGQLIDLCYGPHVTDTGKIKAMTVLKNSSSYFLGDSKNESLQRIYGISFPDQKQLKEYKVFLEEAAKRDHRRIGQDQELFFFNDLSPGSCFFLPHGTRIYNTLVDLQKSEYRKRGFHEVVTPNMYNTKLWETSGHWQNYQENMFSFDVEKEKFALKPMNCPGHCVMFGHRERSYRDLPLRYADFGVLHRNEFSGALTGLTRVRRFQQDDAHIFCTVEQIGSEIQGCLEFLAKIYGIFGFDFHLCLSTRPEKYLGELETWERAEGLLEEALNGFGHEWTMNPGDGAFYGPKIDITISDALRRKHQCATIQLDFQLPERFNLNYMTPNPDLPTSRPVMIHRAILGSVERMIAILTEHTAGRWPFWLSPRQLIVIPVAAPYFAYAQKLSDEANAAGLYCDVDLSDSTLPKKIRNAEIQQYNFVLVVGADEESTGAVNVRNREATGKNRGEVKDFRAVLKGLLELKESRSRTQDLE